MTWGKKAGVDDLLQKLENPKTARCLYIMSTRSISDLDMVQLAASISRNTRLEELYLSGHALGPLGLKAFAQCLAINSTLRHLSLGSENLGDKAVQALSASLARNAQSGLQSWDLEFKSLGLDGAAAIAELLQMNQSLATLNCSRNHIGDQGVAKLAEGLRRNAQSGLKELHLTNVEMSGAGLDHLATLLESTHCSIATLQLSFNALEHATSTFFDAMAMNKSLTKLQLKECKVRDEQVAALATALKQNTTLIEIDLSDNELTQGACTALAQGLRENRGLKRLHLDNNKCLDAGAVRLANVLARHNATLTCLSLSNNDLTSVGMTPLLTAQSLTQLHLFNNNLGTGLKELLPVLVANSVIETLNLGANQLHDALSVTLFNALHSHPSLQTLEMGGNTLGKEGLEALDKLKEVNCRLDIAVDKNAQNEHGRL